jgi:hypothetical protein
MHDGRVSFEGQVARRLEASPTDALLAPASGIACVHWRLKITEPIDARLQLVHEVVSVEGFDLTWLGSRATARAMAIGRQAVAAAETLAPSVVLAAGSGPLALDQPRRGAGSFGEEAIRIRVDTESLELRAAPVLHRPGTPGALKVAEHLGLSRAISVEEIVLTEGERVQVAGVLDGGGVGPGAHRGPFREVASPLELHQGSLVVAHRRELGPALLPLLPWALGTAAAILGGVGATAWAAWRFDLLGGFGGGAPSHLEPPAQIGPDAPNLRAHFSRPD